MTKETTTETLGNIDEQYAIDWLSSTGVSMRIGPFIGHVIIRLPKLIPVFSDLYRAHPLLQGSQVHSFRVSIEPVRHLRRIYRPLVRFMIDGRSAHEDMPRDHALAVLEWGINLAIAFRSHNFLMLHSAVLEKNGVCLVMPAAPGDGKSTLCAALSMRGWRLFSDEFGLVLPGTSEFVPAPRPIALKNESIDVMKRFASDAYVGPNIVGTRKGTVAHMRPTDESVRKASLHSNARLLVFPKWKNNAKQNIATVPKAEAFMQLASNAFNYELVGEDGFNSIATIIGQSACFQLEYSELDMAVSAINELAANVDG